MDEPFGALDAQTRTQLQSELLETWERDQKTCFFILVHGLPAEHQPSGKAILEVTFTFFTLGDCCLRPEFLQDVYKRQTPARF